LPFSAWLRQLGKAQGALSVMTGMVTSQIWLALDTAFVAVLVALAVRQIAFRSRVQFPFSSKLNLLHIVVATLIGGLARHELAIDLKDPPCRL
jgi:hypothetical protein